MKKEFSLEHGGPKRIRVTWAGQLKNAEVFFDSAKIASFATANDFSRGTTVKLPDGSLLSVRWGPVPGIPILKGVHIVRNGLPIPGTAADPLPTWAWPFMIACALIPVVTLGGALPALIGFAGASGTMTISRLNKRSRAVRVVACAAVTVVCWTALALLIYGVQKTSASVRQTPAPAVAPRDSEPSLRGGPRNPLLSDIEQTYRDKGFQEDYIKESVDQFDERCRRMDEEKCDLWLRATLQNIREHAISIHSPK
jgi:hypothetical protein